MNDEEAIKRLKQLEKTAQRACKIREKKAQTLTVKARPKARIARLAFFGLIFFILFPPFYWPLNGPISSEFLFRFKPDSLHPAIEFHNGIDIAVREGTGIFPAGFGIVKFAGYDQGLGYYVVVEHPLGFTSVYGHLSKISTRKYGVAIPGITKLGESGTTGRSTGPHLHFSIKFLGLAMPPKILLIFHSIRKAVIRF